MKVSEKPKLRGPYLSEFRRQMVELIRSGRTPAKLSREFEPAAQSIWNWFRQAGRDGGARKEGGVTSAEREELTKLWRENHRLRRERDILAEAVSVGRIRPTAREKAPNGSSNS